MEGEERRDGRRTVEKSAEQWPPEPVRDRESASLGRTGSGFSRLERKSDGRTEGKQWLEDKKTELHLRAAACLCASQHSMTPALQTPSKPSVCGDLDLWLAIRCAT
ncbi:hypothetical protein Q7C36_010699 [Tachysurus vachellii]|uniref:Uncharacterized protein n=1 Tax=Tachysurus vachellii TaxID=175792 RepID=A0AA88MW49_TACVA|nr:hypothetical protein Q7C36_010699 [Tachysurus vachellii]